MVQLMYLCSRPGTVQFFNLKKLTVRLEIAKRDIETGSSRSS
jgi:hypothetical protein